MTDSAPWLVPTPDVVYVPSQRVQLGDEQAQLELRRTDEGSVVLMAYTSPEALVRACGPDQPWVALLSDTVDALLPGLGVTAVLLDHPLPPS